MLTDVHEGKIEIPLNLSAGDNIIVAGDPERWIYVHEIIGDMDSAGLLEIRAGATVVGNFDLDEGQGVTEDDVPGDDGKPRYKIRPGQDFIIACAGDFTGSCQYSFRY